MPKKIAIDARRLRASTGRYTRELLDALQDIDQENEYHVIVHTEDQTHWSPRNENFYLHVVPYDHYTFSEQLGLARFLQKLKVDLVHFTMPQQPLLYFGKRVTTVHDLTLIRFKNLDKNRIIYAIEQTIFKLLLWNVARRSKHLITPTKFVKNDIVDYAGLKKSKVTHTYEANASMADVKPKPVVSLKGKDFIVYVGNAFPHKNLARAIDAFIELQEKYPKLHFALVGKKEFFYEELEKKYGDVKNLHFFGFVPDDQVKWMYSHAQAYVFPSLSEGFGLPPLDAMEAGLPVVSSNATCLPEVYGEAAHYFDPNDTQDTARAMDEVLRSQARRDELIKNGHKQVAKYSWSRMAKQTHKIYLGVLED